MNNKKIILGIVIAIPLLAYGVLQGIRYFGSETPVDFNLIECNLRGGEWIKRWDMCNLTDKTCTDPSQCEDVRDFVDKPESSDVSIYCIGRDGNSTVGKCGVVANVRGCHHFIYKGNSNTLCAD